MSRRIGWGASVYWRGDAAAPTNRRVEIYIAPRDLWVGVFVSPEAVYVCPFPTVVVRLARGTAVSPARHTDPWAPQPGGDDR